MLSIFRQTNALLLVTLVAVLAVAGCNSNGTGVSPTRDYGLAGVVIEDANGDSAVVAVNLTVDGETFVHGTVKFSGETLPFDTVFDGLDSVYASRSLKGEFAGLSSALVERDGNRLIDSMTVVAVDSFAISSRTPAQDTLTPPWTVSLEWSGSANAETYVLASVKAAEAYTGTGYCEYVLNLANAGTFPPDAFLLPGAGEPDTGLYYLYVYAINGSPDSVLSHELLPVPLPSQEDPNVSDRNITGRFGTVMVALRDSIRVAVIQ